MIFAERAGPHDPTLLIALHPAGRASPRSLLLVCLGLANLAALCYKLLIWHQ
jgi:hypothetical protein